MSHLRTGVATATAIGSVSHPLDTAWHQRFSGVAHATRAVAGQRGKLDPDGCLVRFGFATSRARKRARLDSARSKVAYVVASYHRNGLRLFDFVLDSGRLMDVRFFFSSGFNFQIASPKGSIPGMTPLLSADAVPVLPKSSGAFRSSIIAADAAG